MECYLYFLSVFFKVVFRNRIPCCRLVVPPSLIFYYSSFRVCESKGRYLVVPPSLILYYLSFRVCESKGRYLVGLSRIKCGV